MLAAGQDLVQTLQLASPRAAVRSLMPACSGTRLPIDTELAVGETGSPQVAQLGGERIVGQHHAAFAAARGAGLREVEHRQIAEAAHRLAQGSGNRWPRSNPR